MEREQFKSTLIEMLNREVNKPNRISVLKSQELDVIKTLPKCNLDFIETGDFTRIEWNTYSTILNLQVPIDKLIVFENLQEMILEIAKKIYGRQGDHFLTEIRIGVLLEQNERIDFSDISITETIKRSLNEADVLMNQQKYDQAFTLIHTAFTGYLRNILNEKGIQYNERDTLNQLYNMIHNSIQSEISSPEIADLVKAIIRGNTGSISAINEIRNRHTLAHPNEVIIEKREAEFAIKIIKILTDYINCFI